MRGIPYACLQGVIMKLKCDMEKECDKPVTHIDSSGFVYCEFHGKQKQSYARCRKLTKSELKQLQAETPLTKY